jgi:superfamily II DNA or RNA helicase
MGVRIILQRTRILVTGYTSEKPSKSWLARSFMLWEHNARFGGRYVPDKTYSHTLKDGTVIFPRTAQYKHIITRLQQEREDYEGVFDETNNNLVEYRPMSSSMRIKPGKKPSDEFQEEAIKFLSVPAVNNIHFRLLSLGAGLGKTFVALAAICSWNRKTLVITHNLTAQWVNEILDKTDIHYTKICEFDGVKSIEKTLSEGPFKHDLYLATDRTLMIANETGLYEYMCRKLGIGLIVVDEIHVSTYTHIYLNMSAQVQEIIYLSATPNRSSSAEDSLLQRVFRNLVQYGEDAIDFKKHHINVIYLFYDTKPKYHESAKCQSFYGFQQTAFAKHIFDEKRKEIMFDILNWAISTALKAIDHDEKIVIILELKDHVRMVCEYIRDSFPGITVGDFTSNIDPKHKRESLNSSIIVSTSDSFGVGIDMGGKLRVLINTISYQSKVQAHQLPRRLRPIPGKKTYYIDCVNTGFSRAMEHYKIRSKYISRFAASVQTRRYGEDI